jgi:hypothetical protein
MVCAAGNSPRVLRGEKRDDAADVVRLRDAFESLHAKRRPAPRLRPCKVRHVRLDDARH